MSDVGGERAPDGVSRVIIAAVGEGEGGSESAGSRGVRRGEGLKKQQGAEPRSAPCLLFVLAPKGHRRLFVGGRLCGRIDLRK